MLPWIIATTILAQTPSFELASIKPQLWTNEGAEQPSDSPSVLIAVQRQLWLKLEPGSAPYDTVVIDHAEQPSAN